MAVCNRLPGVRTVAKPLSRAGAVSALAPFSVFRANAVQQIGSTILWSEALQRCLASLPAGEKFCPLVCVRFRKLFR